MFKINKIIQITLKTIQNYLDHRSTLSGHTYVSKNI